MADLKHNPGGIAHLRDVYYHDEGDGTHTERFAAALRGYNPVTLTWDRVPVDNATGALLVSAAISTGDIEIGAVELKDGTTDNRASVSAAGALEVDGSAVTQPVSLASVPTHGVTGPLTDSELRATAVPVSLASVPSHAVTATDLDIRNLVAATDIVTVEQATAASLNAQVVGAGASGAASVGNPVGVGGIYKTTMLTLTDGQRSDLTTDSRQALQVTLMTRASGVAAFTASSPGRIDPTGTTAQPVTNTGTFAVQAAATLAAETTKVIGTVNQSTGQGKTLLFGAITQGAAGTTQLVAADGTKKVKLVSYVIVLDAAGSVKFTDGTVDLTGVMPIAANGGVSAIAAPSSHLLETAAVNRALSITTVTGKAFGHYSYFLEA